MYFRLIPGSVIVSSTPSAADIVAWNGEARAVITGVEHDPGEVNPDEVEITLRHNEEVINETRGGVATGGQYATLLETVNNFVERGIRSARIVLSQTEPRAISFRLRPGRTTPIQEHRATRNSG